MLSGAVAEYGWILMVENAARLVMRSYSTAISDRVSRGWSKDPDDLAMTGHTVAQSQCSDQGYHAAGQIKAYEAIVKSVFNSYTQSRNAIAKQQAKARTTEQKII
jgi:hypothetical protein